MPSRLFVLVLLFLICSHAYLPYHSTCSRVASAISTCRVEKEKLKANMVSERERERGLTRLMASDFGSESETEHVSLDLDGAQIEEAEVDVDALDGEEEESEEIVEPAVTYKKRRATLASALAATAVPGSGARKQTWEERYDDDPLRADSPTKEWDKPPIRFAQRFLALSGPLGQEQNHLSARKANWLTHLQWARRSSLEPTAPAAVLQGFTCLSQDMQRPTGQVLMLGANDTAAVIHLMDSEPLAAAKCFSSSVDWTLFATEAAAGLNLSNAEREPMLFIGMYSKQAAGDDELLAIQQSYHEQAGDRVVSLLRLRDLQAQLKGIAILFNARSNKDAQTYMSLDPAAAQYTSSQLGPVNEQDIDGLHLLMPRQFSERTNLEKIHNMDPEDLLLLPSTTTEQAQLNAAFIASLQARNITYRYTRLDLKDCIETEISTASVTARNAEMGKFQRVRLQSVVDDLDVSVGETVGSDEEA